MGVHTEPHWVFTRGQNTQGWLSILSPLFIDSRALKINANCSIRRAKEPYFLASWPIARAGAFKSAVRLPLVNDLRL